MTTKSPRSRCGAYWGLCLPRSRIAVWLASRPSTTSVASMTCQARAISPGLGEYVRTALVSSVVVGMAGGIASPSTGDGTTRGHQPACARQPITIPVGDPRPSAPLQGPAARSRVVGGSGVLDLADASRLHVVDQAPHLAGEQVRALLDQPDRLADVVVDDGEEAGRPRRTAAGGLLDEVGEADVVALDRKSTRLNSSHANISYAVFCLKKKK